MYYGCRCPCLWCATVREHFHHHHTIHLYRDIVSLFRTVLSNATLQVCFVPERDREFHTDLLRIPSGGRSFEEIASWSCNILFLPTRYCFVIRFLRCAYVLFHHIIITRISNLRTEKIITRWRIFSSLSFIS